MNSGCHIFTNGFQPQTSNSSNGSGQTVQKQIWDHEAVFQFEFWRFFGPFFSNSRTAAPQGVHAEGVRPTTAESNG